MKEISKEEIDAVTDRTRQWLERAVIGLNLCPFAKAVHTKNQIRYVVSQATSEEELAEQLAQELASLAAENPAKVDTTLLIHPYVLNDFLDYNAFLDVTDALIDEMELEGEIQVASFHPDYQFADTEPEDISNYTNRSPFPILHLLREMSIERAVKAFPDAKDIYETNIATLKTIGQAGWKKIVQDGGLE